MDDPTWYACQIAIHYATRFVAWTDRADAQQDAWVACLDALPHYTKTRGSLPAFLQTVAKRAVWRSLRRFDPPTEPVDVEAATPPLELRLELQTAWQQQPSTLQHAWTAIRCHGAATAHYARHVGRTSRTIQRWCQRVDHALCTAALDL